MLCDLIYLHENNIGSMIWCVWPLGFSWLLSKQELLQIRRGKYGNWWMLSILLWHAWMGDSGERDRERETETEKETEKPTSIWSFTKQYSIQCKQPFISISRFQIMNWSIIRVQQYLLISRLCHRMHIS